MGCTFLNARITATINIKKDTKNDKLKISRDIPDGANTVSATDRSAAPIMPTTQGFKPDMQPLTILFS